MTEKSSKVATLEGKVAELKRANTELIKANCEHQEEIGKLKMETAKAKAEAQSARDLLRNEREKPFAPPLPKKMRIALTNGDNMEVEYESKFLRGSWFIHTTMKTVMQINPNTILFMEECKR